MNPLNRYQISYLTPIGLSAFLFCVLFALPCPGGAQTVLNQSCHAMRPGDCLVKQQVEYKAPGREGENVLWDFSQQQPFDDHYRVSYYGVPDSLVIGEEHGALYRYLFRGDSLLLAGVENPTTLLANREPELQLVFPVAYGDRHEAFFHGNGDYGNHLFITARGKVSLQADATGTLLLPQGDTLRNVLRVRHVKNISEQMVPYAFILPGDTVFSPDTIEARLAADTLLMQVETYRWYAPGWRYPVYETVSNRYVVNEKPVEYSRSSFYYKPVDQYYDLDSDPVNQAVREKEQERLRAEQERTQREDAAGNRSKEVIQYDSSLTDGNNTLNLDYCLNEDAEVSFMLFDMQGRQLTGLQKGLQPAGFYRVTFSLAGFQPGEYTLRIVAGGEVSGIKIIK